MRHYDRQYVDGAWMRPLGRKTFEIVNPTTEEPFATVTLGTTEDVDLAVAAARRAFPAFSTTSKVERLDLLRRIVQAIAGREADLAAAVAEEMGGPRSNRIFVEAGLESFRQTIAALEEYEFEKPFKGHLLQHEAIGVCGLITAWNWPVQILCTKVSSALAAGCTVVLKPSEYTSTCAMIFADALHTAGVPKGVFNLVVGDGPVVGSAMCAHPGIDIVSITGSTRAGIAVAKAAAATVKRVSQELGGKSAHVVLPDADLAAAARWSVSRGFTNSGQSCHAPTRILVHRAQVEEVLDLMQAEVAKIRIGDPQDPVTTMGPVVNKSQFSRIQDYIRIGEAEGARLACGGPGRPEGIERGYFVRPTIFADVAPGSRLEQEEIFGPVLAVIAYDTEDEAVEIANGTPYGLGGYVSAGDPERGLAVGRRLRAGRVFLNGAGSSAALPMGGYKQSGNGREMGVFGLEEYLEVKAMFGFGAAA